MLQIFCEKNILVIFFQNWVAIGCCIRLQTFTGSFKICQTTVKDV